MPHYYADQDTHIALRDACFVLHASSFSDTHYDEYACVQPPELCFIATDGVAQRLSRASKFRWNLQTPSPASYVVNQGVDPGPVTPSRASIALRPVLEMRGVHMLVSRCGHRAPRALQSSSCMGQGAVVSVLRGLPVAIPALPACQRSGRC